MGSNNSSPQLFPDKLIMTPRAILTRIFAVQGIHTDPDSLSTLSLAVDQIAAKLLHEGLSGGDGVSSFGCFLSYRVNANKNEARILHLMLKLKGIHSFLDSECLVHGENWKDGFLSGLSCSNIFVPLISRSALKSVRDSSVDHTQDNMLIEYQAAINRLDGNIRGDHFTILPIFFGERKGNILENFNDFNTDLYSDSIEAIISESSIDLAPASELSNIDDMMLELSDFEGDFVTLTIERFLSFSARVNSIIAPIFNNNFDSFASNHSDILVSIKDYNLIYSEQLFPNNEWLRGWHATPKNVREFYNITGFKRQKFIFSSSGTRSYCILRQDSDMDIALEQLNIVIRDKGLSAIEMRK